MKQKKHKQFKSYLFSIFIFLIGAFFVDSVYIEPNKLEVKNIEIKKDDVASEFAGKSIVFLSDIHYGVGDRSRLDRAVDKINEINPDVVILGGDYIDSDANLVPECFSKLEKIKASVGIYAVLGNHDMDVKIYSKLKEEFKDSKIELLYNDKVFIRGGNSNIVIAGIPYSKRNSNLNLDLTDLNKDDFVILASHNPDLVEQQKLLNVDVVLSGHLHGGQINMLGLERFWMPTAFGQKYKSGIIFKDSLEVIVSNGLGGSGLPMRFMAEPDIIQIKISKS